MSRLKLTLILLMVTILVQNSSVSAKKTPYIQINNGNPVVVHGSTHIVIQFGNLEHGKIQNVAVLCSADTFPVVMRIADLGPFHTSDTFVGENLIASVFFGGDLVPIFGGNAAQPKTLDNVDIPNQEVYAVALDFTRNAPPNLTAQVSCALYSRDQIVASTTVALILN